MARYDKDSDFPRSTPNPDKHLDKPKGQMSIREAAAMEMPEQHLETVRPGTVVHGFGEGQTPMEKRHTGIPTADMQMGMQQQPSPGESVTMIIEQVFQLPFHAQASVLRMIASRVLGAMDARDQENFLRDLRADLGKMMSGEESTATSSTNTEDIQGT
ncbi:MAG: hypothetical protein ACXU86_10380 [Archangium sp.]